ncbi:MAG: hypothetical protein C1O27_002135 [Chloroflexi bacterium]|nr:MAG: hypothetical protein C1O27_002135 [Chloroflexota bacterium]
MVIFGSETETQTMPENIFRQPRCALNPLDGAGPYRIYLPEWPSEVRPS